MRVWKFCVLVWFAVVASGTSTAQALEEIVVTASRVSDSSELPGRFLRRHGDYLLQQVSVVSDTRDEDQRADEIYKTLRILVSSAAKARDIEVSLVEDDVVFPLTTENYRVRLFPGGRSDTSIASISLKTPIGGASADAQELMNRMREFVKAVDVVGRVELIEDGGPQLSVVGPNQYRGQIIAEFADDVANVTKSLGEGYRVIVRDIDRPVQWYRISALELALYIPYSYVVIPETVHSYTEIDSYD